jgi:hypothetical protein
VHSFFVWVVELPWKKEKEKGQKKEGGEREEKVVSL